MTYQDSAATGNGVADRRIPANDVCVLKYMLEKQAAQNPTHEAVVFDNGESYTYLELLRRVSIMGRKLQDLGINQGDKVFVWLPNGAECFTAWYAINFIGAIYVPANTSYRGALLERVILDSGAKLALVHSDLVPRLNGVSRGNLETLIVFYGDARGPDGLHTVMAAELSGEEDALPLERPINPWDVQSIIYTSGTTGPSKGVLVSYMQTFASANPQTFITSSDRLFSALPLFHSGATIPCYVALMRGATVVLVSAFSTDLFWTIVKEYRVTQATLLGVMCAFLTKQTTVADASEETLRTIVSVPFTPEVREFALRFKVDVYTFFNMTETSLPLISSVNPTAFGTCGKPRQGVEARIVDDNDCEVEDGQIGELIVRSDCPWELAVGYNNNPKATADSWRNGWFHTGDAFRKGECGDYFFMDRIKDAIRRRGENISSHEVEVEVCAHPNVREAAAIAVPSEQGEDEVLIAISLVGGESLDPSTLIEFLIPRMPHFMVPRYVRILKDLPKTPTHKIQKNLLRGDGITVDTWDRVISGITLKKEKLGAGPAQP